MKHNLPIQRQKPLNRIGGRQTQNAETSPRNLPNAHARKGTNQRKEWGYEGGELSTTEGEASLTYLKQERYYRNTFAGSKRKRYNAKKAKTSTNISRAEIRSGI